MTELLGYDLAGALRNAAAVVNDPASDPKTAMLLLGAVSLLLIIITLIAIVFMLPRGDEEERDSSEDEAAERVTVVRIADARESAPATRTRSVVGPVVLALIAATIWVSAGFVTAQPSMCLSCHADSVHAEAADDDPHADVRCVSCHESGGLPGALTYMLPSRALHFAQEFADPGLGSGPYSRPVSSGNCQRCHDDVARSTSTNELQGVRMSHAEPIEAGAACLDCHVPASGTVSGRTVGMSPCLRCHDDVAVAADCDYCHTTDIGNAVQTSTMTRGDAAALIDQPDCGGCHPQDSCDACHGLRMPHTREFRLTGHARPGAEDIWFNGGKTCSKCHNETRRPCTGCHQAMPSHGLTWSKYHQVDPKGCSCHARTEHLYGRVICELCHEPGTGR